MEIADIRRLYRAMKLAGFRTLDLETGVGKVTLSLSREAFAGEPARGASQEEATAFSEGEETPARSVTVFSERVGVFGSGKKSVQAGDEVKKGDILGVIKGISMQDQVICPCAGMVTQVCVRSGEIVEFGKTLFVVEPLLK